MGVMLFSDLPVLEVCSIGVTLTVPRTSHQNCAKRNSPETTDASDVELASPMRLDLLERRLVDSHTTVIIPLDDRVIFVSSLNCAEFSIRLSEVAQTLDAISGSQLLAGGGGLGERG